MQINSTDSHIEVLTSGSPTHCVLWLHGLGADGNDFVPIVQELSLPESTGLKFIFPHAPIIAVTINNGYKMRAWFDIKELSMNAAIDQAGIEDSTKKLTTLIDEQKAAGFPAEKIILAGFSQGGVITLNAGLTYPEKLGGLLVLSSYLPLASDLLEKKSSASQDTPIFMAHGTQDPVLPFLLGETTADTLRQADYKVDFHAYDMPHCVIPAEIADISAWLSARLI